MARRSTVRSGLRNPNKSDQIPEEDLQQDHLTIRNSYFPRRTVSRTSQLGCLNDKQDQISLTCDFLDLITAIQGLYMQGNVLEMQQIDNAAKSKVGQGAVFEVSTITAQSSRPSRTVAGEIRREKRHIILKHPEKEMFTNTGANIEGEHRQSAASFIIELRILSFPPLRSHKNIVKLLGLGWEYSKSVHGCPWPSLILEAASCDLTRFLEQNKKLPYETKHTFCVDIANGLSVLHNSGIIHGDVKPDNILIFENSRRLVAKIADFSHSLLVLETKKEGVLPGGSVGFRAPEWKQKLPTSLLCNTDVYSYGIVFACVILGYDVIATFSVQPRYGRTGEERAQHLDLLQKNGKFKDTLNEMLYESEDTDLTLRRERLQMLQSVLDLTLHKDIAMRDLSAVKWQLQVPGWSNSLPDSGSGEALRTPRTRLWESTVLKQINSNILAIPYYAMRDMSHALKAQTVMALERLAGEITDDRSKAACWELCVCYCTGFGVEVDYPKAMCWLVSGAERKDIWARSMIVRLAEAMLQPVPESLPIDDWLADAARQGSVVALESLKERRPSMFKELQHNPWLKITQTPTQQQNLEGITIVEEDASTLQDCTSLVSVENRDVNGNTRLHLAAMRGELELLQEFAAELQDNKALLDSKNNYGDTPILCACKSASEQFVITLLKLGADPSIVNAVGETCLHLLVCFDDDKVYDLASTFFLAGVDWTREASASSLSSEYSVYPIATGCPKVRAVQRNRPHVLDVLLRLEKAQEQKLSETEEKLQGSTFRVLIALACRQSNDKALDVLFDHMPDLFSQKRINAISLWIERKRYSLAALVIAGCIGPTSAVGFDMPEALWRCLMYGRHRNERMENTLNILGKHGLDFVHGPCVGDRNALFFAIREDREDIVQFFLKWRSEDDMFAPFGSVAPNGLDNGDNLPIQSSNGKTVNHRRKVLMTKAIKLAIMLGRRNVFQILLQYHAGEALDRGVEFHVTLSHANHAHRMKSRHWPWLLTRRNSSLELMQTWPTVDHLFPTMYPLSGENLMYETLFEGTKRKSGQGAEFSDGRLNYALLYMGFIVVADHRDIFFANTLVQELEKRGVTDHCYWIPRTRLEQRCFPNSSAPPLLMSAYYQWEELTQFLLHHGADPRAYALTGKYREWSPLSLLLPRESEYFLDLDKKRYDTLVRNNPQWGLRAVARLFRASRELLEPLKPSLPGEILALMNLHRLNKGLDLGEVWQAVEDSYRGRQWLTPRDSSMAVKLAAQRYDSRALMAWLSLGGSTNGGSRWFSATPLDYVESEDRRTFSGEESPERRNCRRILLEHKAHRGKLYLIEAQLLGNLFVFVLSTAFIYGVFGTVEKQGQVCTDILSAWLESYKAGRITSWTLVFRVPFAYAIFLPLVITILGIVLFILLWINDNSPLYLHDYFNFILGVTLPFTVLSTGLNSQKIRLSIRHWWYGPTAALLRRCDRLGNKKKDLEINLESHRVQQANANREIAKLKLSTANDIGHKSRYSSLFSSL